MATFRRSVFQLFHCRRFFAIADAAAYAITFRLLFADY